jgi:hypothetical protein
MEKNIKDYLHLYIGCRAEATTVEGAVSNVAISYTLLHDWDGWLERIKPILRKLSSMTEEEFQHMINEGWIGAPTFTNWTKIVYKPEQFRYLLAKGFDLFGLIDSGLAIEKQS